MSIAGVFGLLVFLIMVVVPLASGVLLIVFSRRRGPDHPACGKCGYNVQASIDSGTRCPECGADFGQAGITPPRGKRKRNPFMIGVGLVLIVLAVGCFSSSLLFQRATIAQSQAARSAAAQKAPAPADAAQPEAEDHPEGD
jgi:hypothetical protein